MDKQARYRKSSKTAGYGLTLQPEEIAKLAALDPEGSPTRAAARIIREALARQNQDRQNEVSEG